METDLTRMREILVGLPDVNVLGITEMQLGPIDVHIEKRGIRPGCQVCGVIANAKERVKVGLVDLPSMIWRKRSN